MRALIVGAGDLGCRLADGLAATGNVDEIVLAGLCQGRGPWLAGMIALCGDTPTRFVELNGTDQSATERLLKREKPDLVVQSGTLFSPFLIAGRQDPLAVAMKKAGVAVQLPRQLPLVHTLMRAVRSIGFTGPVANLSAPDLTHPVLAKLGLAPTIGLGNVSMYWLKARAELRRRAARNGEDPHQLPLVRVVGHHNHGYAIFEAVLPPDPTDRCRVYLGEHGERADDLPYGGFPIPRDLSLNEPTAASALAVLRAFLADAPPLQISAPGPEGLPGGYPVRIDNRRVALDLPPGASRAEAIEFNERAATRDGIDCIADDGTVVFTAAAAAALENVAPALAEPLDPAKLLDRCNLIVDLLKA